jgi:phosphatidylserine/phosphatidylglycerophosphate/cardiolipin synthase-like enzyme
MARFYLLPPRDHVGKQVSRLLQTVLPGLSLAPELCLEWLQSVIAGAGEEVYLVHREDLPDQNLTASLRDGFGAEVGDRVVQVVPGPIVDQPTVRIWNLEAENTPTRGVAFV